MVAILSLKVKLSQTNQKFALKKLLHCECTLIKCPVKHIGNDFPKCQDYDFENQMPLRFADQKIFEFQTPWIWWASRYDYIKQADYDSEVKSFLNVIFSKVATKYGIRTLYLQKINFRLVIYTLSIYPYWQFRTIISYRERRSLVWSLKN